MREIYYNGVIYTGTGRDAEAMAVEDGRIAGVGNLTDLETCSIIWTAILSFRDLTIPICIC